MMSELGRDQDIEALLTAGFDDPLCDYEPRAYQDVLEEALAERPVAAINAQPFIAVGPDTPVREAVALLADLNSACLLVAEGDSLLGVFTGRDVLDKLAGAYDRLKDQPIRELMTRNPVFVYETDSSGAALSVMAASGYRHVPVLDGDDKIVGIVGPSRVTDFLREHF